jgi:putative hydrolase of the HAD superfamily
MLPNFREKETVLLDMDGTLLDLHYDNYFWQHYLPQVYAQAKEIDEASALAHLMPIFKAHQGTLNWYCVDFWSEELGVDIMHHKAQVADRIAYRPQAEAFLQTCQDEVEDTRLITNGHRKVLDLKMAVTGLDKYFREMICSHELGAAKEQQVFWQRLQSMNEFEPETTLFIDDNEAVLDSAHKFGIRHLYSVAQPDSVTPRSSLSKYPMLDDFFARAD